MLFIQWGYNNRPVFEHAGLENRDLISSRFWQELEQTKGLASNWLTLCHTDFDIAKQMLHVTQTG